MMRRWLASTLRTCLSSMSLVAYPLGTKKKKEKPSKKKKRKEKTLLTYCAHLVLLQVAVFACAAEQHVLADEQQQQQQQQHHPAATTPATSVETDIVEVARNGWTPYQSGMLRKHHNMGIPALVVRAKG